jgi:hypothetical protein
MRGFKSFTAAERSAEATTNSVAFSAPAPATISMSPPTAVGFSTAIASALRSQFFGRRSSNPSETSRCQPWRER